MKLQINDRGSWRHAQDFQACDLDSVKAFAADGLSVVNSRAKLRILNDDKSVLAYCQAPSFSWTEPGQGRPA